MSFSDLMEYRILDAFVDNLPWVNVGNPHWMGLCIAQPEEDGSEDNEVSMVEHPDYSRISVVSADWYTANVDGSGNTYVNNCNELAFVEATSDWGLITHFALWSAETGGLFLLWGILEEAYEIVSGSVPRFDAEMIKITLG